MTPLLRFGLGNHEPPAEKNKYAIGIYVQVNA